MGKILVLGLGNLLLQDEGVGMRAVERLQECYEFPEEVELLDGGVLGLNLLAYLENVSRVLIIDAVESSTSPAVAPGTLIRLEDAQIPASIGLKLSPHQVGLSELLALARLQGFTFEKVVLWGLQPHVTSTGLELSPAVAAQLDVLIQNVVRELRSWGLQIRVKEKHYA
jgi:hydrogenase maturation protease